jgi:hypothetical protein
VQIAIPLFTDLTVLDAIGPNEILSRLPGRRRALRRLDRWPGPVGERGAAARRRGRLRGRARAGRDRRARRDGHPAADRDERLLGWLRTAHETSTWTTSVCTGALLLAAAGILDGVDATTHWLARDELAALGARPVADRVVERGRVITAAGVSSGIDMALVLAERLAGADVAQALQLATEYDPQPPFDAGSPDKAPAHVVALVRAVQHERLRAA